MKLSKEVIAEEAIKNIEEKVGKIKEVQTEETWTEEQKEIFLNTLSKDKEFKNRFVIEIMKEISQCAKSFGIHTTP